MADDTPDTTRPAVLEPLRALVGTWSLEGAHVQLPDPIRGRKTYEWLGQFLVEHSHYEHPDIPDSIAIIGAGEEAPLVEHYFDVRGVRRVYQMSFADGVWKFWRDAPGFSQRTTGKFSDDGNRITVLAELSRDDATWHRDLELTYTKVT